MKAYFGSGPLTVLAYTLAGTVFVIGSKWKGAYMLAMGLGFLVLAAVQGWLCLRKAGRDRERFANLLLGPAFAIFGASNLYRASAHEDGLSVWIGFGWLALAAFLIYREFGALKNGGTKD